MIANSGHDERGKYSGGQAGDQTGTEWQIREWYSRPWTHVFRYPVKEVRDMIAELAEEAARNDKIGYDQWQRTTFWAQLEASGYRPENIKTACEADCSAGVAAIVKATGFLMNIDELKAVSPDMYTGNAIRILTDAGFSMYTDKAFLESDQYALRGDIYMAKGQHMCINLTDGPKTLQSSWHWVKFDGDWFYQDQNGKKWTGWAKIKETQGFWYHWYWFDQHGVMAKGARQIDGRWYFFMPEGSLEGAQCITDTAGALNIWNISE